MITTCNKRMMGGETLRWFGVQERKRGLAVWPILLHRISIMFIQRLSHPCRDDGQ